MHKQLEKKYKLFKVLYFVQFATNNKLFFFKEF